ncbi:MAG: HNH endonuclease signature motif containing protein, partial [Nocardioides sp.]
MSEGTLNPDPRHRVAATVTSLRTDLDELRGASLWSMDAHEAGATLVELTRLGAQVAELTMRVARHAESVDVGASEGATSVTNWWAHHTRMTRAEAHRCTRLAGRLEAQPSVREALAAGEVLTDQAAVITDALDALPADLVDADVAARAEAYLLAEARHHDAKALRVLGRRILDVVAPQVGEAHEARLLEKEEADAQAAGSFTMSEDGHGQCHGRFRIPALHGAMLRKHLLAIAAPKHRAATGQPVAGRELPTRHRMGQAFCDYIESRRPDTVTDAGGVAATVVVTMGLDALFGGLGAASLDTGGRISAGEARRLACRAGIIPAVLGGPSQVLDLGRKTRFHTGPQRIALALR